MRSSHSCTEDPASLLDPASLNTVDRGGDDVRLRFSCDDVRGDEHMLAADERSVGVPSGDGSGDNS